VLHATSCVHSLLLSVLRDPCRVLEILGRPGIRTCLQDISAPMPIIHVETIRKSSEEEPCQNSVGTQTGLGFQKETGRSDVNRAGNVCGDRDSSV